MHSLSILGCGWLGERIGKSFYAKGWSINASSRNEERLKELTAYGFQAYQIDIENFPPIVPDFFNADYLIIATTNKNYLAHIKLCKIIDESRVQKVFFISSTSVYIKTVLQPTLNTPLNDSPLVSIEKIYLNNPKSCIIRCGGLVGDNRQPGNFFKKGAVIKNPNGKVNLIHYEAIISHIYSLIESKNPPSISNLVQASNKNRFEFYSRAYQELHGEEALFTK